MEAQNYEVDVYKGDQCITTVYVTERNKADAEQEAILTIKNLVPDIFNNSVLRYDVREPGNALLMHVPANRENAGVIA